MLDQWLASLSTKTIVTLSLVIGLVVILIFNPPHSPCQSQMELFKKSQTPFLYKTDKKFAPEPGYSKAHIRCKQTNTSGGCLELFSGIREATQHLHSLSTNCRSEVESATEIHQMVWEGLELLVTLAWGERPPESEAERLGWMDASHVRLFCDLKNLGIQMNGEARWKEFYGGLLTALPGVESMAPAEVWRRSIVSTACPR